MPFLADSLLNDWQRLGADADEADEEEDDEDEEND